MGADVVAPIGPQHEADWARMRSALWPDEDAADLAREARAWFERGVPGLLAVLVALEGTRVIGFAELGIRPYAEGCVSERVAFLEAWFVEPAARRRGAGRALVAACEAWARGQGCTEFASDAQADNTLGAAAHAALGFEDAGVVRCFRKTLA